MLKGLLNGKADHKVPIIIITSGIVLGIFLLSLHLGRYQIASADLWQLILHPGQQVDNPDANVFFYIRLPRILVAILVGAALSAAGALFQGLFRNPLVSPDILGVSSGCCVGAALGILLCAQSSYLMQILAFVFGIIAMLFAYGIAKAARGEAIIMLVLAGMVVSGFFSAVLSFLKYIADPYEQLPTIVFWIMGGFYRSNWDMVINLFVIVAPCLLILIMLSWKVNVLSLGDEEAASLGINVRWFRFVLISLATMMVAGSVSVSGTISWVGLVMPHIARMLVGADHRLSIPASMLVGSGFVLLMDDLARTFTTAEIPISIMTAAVGAPFFAYLLIRGKGKAWR